MRSPWYSSYCDKQGMRNATGGIGKARTNADSRMENGLISWANERLGQRNLMVNEEGKGQTYAKQEATLH